MTVRLRGHHLLCLLTYKGKGYGPAFVANLDRIAARLTAGEEVLLVDGPDDVCAPLRGGGAGGEDAPHCGLERIRGRDRRALEAISALLNRRLGPGERLTLDRRTSAGLRRAFRAGEIRTACAGCEWANFCSSIAEAAFAGTRLHGRQGAVRPAWASSQPRKAAIVGSSARSSRQTT